MDLRRDGKMPDFHAERTVVFYYRVVTRNEAVHVFKDISHQVADISRCRDCAVFCFWKKWIISSFFSSFTLKAESRQNCSIAITGPSLWLYRLNLFPTIIKCPTYAVNESLKRCYLWKWCTYLPPILTFGLDFSKSPPPVHNRISSHLTPFW